MVQPSWRIFLGVMPSVGSPIESATAVPMRRPSVFSWREEFILSWVPCVREELKVEVIVFLFETAESNLDGAGVLILKIGAGLHGDFGGPVLWKVVDSGGDAGEGDAGYGVIETELEGGLVAGGELCFFVVFAAVPDGADGVDEVFCGESVAFGDF